MNQELEQFGGVTHDQRKDFEMINCDKCENNFYPKGKCPRYKWEDCKKRESTLGDAFPKTKEKLNKMSTEQMIRVS